MARIDISYAKSLYFCGVKNQLRHDVAGYASFFRADNLGEKLYPDECGNSNARKGSAVDTLTARIGILYCLKINCMKDQKIQLTDAQVACIAGIQDYLDDFHSVADLYQRLANALTELMLVEIHMPNEARKKVNDMAQDYLALLNLLDPINPLTHPIEKGE